MNAILAENRIQPMVREAFEVTCSKKKPRATERIKQMLERNDILKVSGLAVFSFILEVTYF